TDKQQSYFEDYYFDNLTLQEIAENSDVSRNAIHKQIKEAEDKLNHFESVLNIYKKNKRIKEICENLNSDIKNKILDIL
ncbi:MAG: HTH domain-containing protein, partial [Bacilli bacterium]|nr:HTH domain-containing protein [Bacilli bacterium]